MRSRMVTHEVYDPSTGTWSEAAPLPRPRDHMAVVAGEGKIHAIGRRLTGPADRTGQHDVYDPATNTWTSAEPLPTARSGVAAALYRGSILVLGGEPIRFQRTRPSMPKPIAGRRLRPCRRAGMGSAARSSGRTSISSAAR